MIKYEEGKEAQDITAEDFKKSQDKVLKLQKEIVNLRKKLRTSSKAPNNNTTRLSSSLTKSTKIPNPPKFTNSEDLT